MIYTYLILQVEEESKTLPANVQGFAMNEFDSFCQPFYEVVAESDMPRYLSDYMHERFTTTCEFLEGNDTYLITEYALCKLSVPECREEDKHVYNNFKIHRSWCNIRCGLEVLETTTYKEVTE